MQGKDLREAGLKAESPGGTGWETTRAKAVAVEVEVRKHV